MGVCQGAEQPDTPPVNRNSKKQPVVEHKVVLVGNSFVGKTSIILQFCDKRFDDQHTATIGTHTRNITIKTRNGDDVTMQIWDTAGQDRFRALLPMYYREARVVVIVYDITDSDSFQACNNWIKNIQSQCKPGCILILVGNKSDLKNERQVKQLEAKNLCSKHEIKLAEVSARTGSGVQQLFSTIAESIVGPATMKLLQDN